MKDPSLNAENLQSPTIEGTTGKSLDEHLRAAAGSGFSGTVLIARGGELLLHSGYGTIDEQGTIEASTNTLYDTGSIVKMFTAAAILKLEDEGRLSVSDLITRYFG